MTHVVIVSSDFYSTSDLADALEMHGVTTSCVYRDYHFDPSLEGIDVVVTDGTCKTRGGDDDLFGGKPYPIYFGEPRKAAKRVRIPFVKISHSYSGKLTPGWIIKRRVRRILAAAKQ